MTLWKNFPFESEDTHASNTLLGILWAVYLYPDNVANVTFPFSYFISTKVTSANHDESTASSFICIRSLSFILIFILSWRPQSESNRYLRTCKPQHYRCAIGSLVNAYFSTLTMFCISCEFFSRIFATSCSNAKIFSSEVSSISSDAIDKSV